MTDRFIDRADAGRALAARLAHLAGRDCIVLALPRGGLPVAYEVSAALGAPLDILNVRKLGVPWQPELAMGAVSTGDVRVLNDGVIRAAGVSAAEIERATVEQCKEIERREQLYRGGRPAPILEGRTVVIVDDGIATGATVRAAIAVVRAQKPTRLVIATPVAAESTLAALARDADEVVSVLSPIDLLAIGLWYDHFPQLTDADVQAVLARSPRRKSDSSASSVASNSASQIISSSPVTDSTR